MSNWVGTTETYYWLEVEPDLWLGTSRLAETIEDVDEFMQLLKKQETTKGDGQRTYAMRCAASFLETTSDSLRILDPA